jgi:hypothetical protein
LICSGGRVGRNSTAAASNRRNSCRNWLRRYDSPRMSKAEKLALKILSGKSDQNFGFDDLCHVIEGAGFQLRSGKGSHRIYYKDGVVEIINVQPRNGKAKPYQVKQVRDLLLKYKIEIE